MRETLGRRLETLQSIVYSAFLQNMIRKDVAIHCTYQLNVCYIDCILTVSSFCTAWAVLHTYIVNVIGILEVLSIHGSDSLMIYCNFKTKKPLLPARICSQSAFAHHDGHSILRQHLCYAENYKREKEEESEVEFAGAENHPCSDVAFSVSHQSEVAPLLCAMS